MHPVRYISACTRWLQKTFPQRPIRGISRLSGILRKHLPDYEAIVPMNFDFRMRLNSQQAAEMTLIMQGTYQAALSYVFAQNLRPDAYYLDVGANLGFFSLWFAKLAGTTGKVAAFEANPRMASRIRDAAEINGFTLDIVEKAVDEHSGQQISFFISTNPGKSSIHAANVRSLVEEIHVETISIDAYLEQMAWPRLDFIKMDIEGNDCRALLGAEKSLRRHRPFIVFEYFAGDASVENRLAALFNELGYRLEFLELNGKRQAFNWQVPAGIEHVDVLCFPAKS